MSKTPEKYYSIVTNKESKTSEILIYGVIGDSWFEESTTARQFVADFRNAEKESERINIRLNSPGGSVFDGLAIYNVISASQKETHTYNDGVAASMAAVLLFSVKPENIHPAKNSLLMLHAPSIGAFGNRSELEDAINVLDKCQKVLVSSICDKTGLDETQVAEKYFDYKDHWFTAQEALDEGFYANIEDEEVENVPRNASTLKFSDLVKLFEPSNTLFPDWVNRIAPQKNNSNIIDMDIKTLKEAYKLPVDKVETEEQMIDFVTKREQEFSDSLAANETLKQENVDVKSSLKAVESDLAIANQSILDKDAEIAELKKGPGATSAPANTATDPANTPVDKDKPAESFGEAYSKCLETLKNKK